MKRCEKCGSHFVTSEPKHYRKTIVWLCQIHEEAWYKIYFANPECKNVDGKWDEFFERFLDEERRQKMWGYIRKLQREYPILRFIESFDI